MKQVMSTIHAQGLALVSIITDDCFDFKHVTVLFCNDCCEGGGGVCKLF